jgi:ribonuclease HI
LKRAYLHADGGARGNPGPAGIGVVLTAEDGSVIAELARPLGVATNNVAEYEALIAGLELALDHGVTDIEVLMDSELVVSQVTGAWKINKEHLRTRAARAEGLLKRFASASLKHVRRTLNTRADELANRAMDEAERAGAARGGGQGELLGG